MGEFREHFISEIRATLSRNECHADDFDLEQKANDDFKILTITYRYRPSFFCQLQVRTRAAKAVQPFVIAGTVEVESAGKIHVFCAPGELLSNERFKYDDSRTAVGAVKSWVDRLRDELLAIPINRRIEEQRKQLEELSAQFADLEDGYFTDQEAEEIKQRLEAFEKQFSERIQAATESSADAERRISELHKEVENLKRQIELLDRKGWVKSAIVRISNWSRDPENRQLLQSTSDLAKSLLLPSVSGRGGS